MTGPVLHGQAQVNQSVPFFTSASPFPYFFLSCSFLYSSLMINNCKRKGGKGGRRRNGEGEMQAGCAKSRRPDCIFSNFPNFPRISGIICYRLVSVDDQSLKDQKQKSIIPFHLSTISLTFTSKHSKESKGETVFPENNSTDFPSPETLLCVHNITHSLPPSLRHTKKERLSECQRTTDVRRIRRGATQLRSTPVLFFFLFRNPHCVPNRL